MIKETFGMTDEDFKTTAVGLEEVKFSEPISLSPNNLPFEKLVGKENINRFLHEAQVFTEKPCMTYSGSERIVENVPDAVLYPRNDEEIEKIVAYCNEHHPRLSSGWKHGHQGHGMHERGNSPRFEKAHEQSHRSQ